MAYYDKNKRVLDLSNKNLKKIPKQDAAQPICSLILDDNDIGNLQNIDSYCSLEKLSIKANRLLRMYSVGQLQYLTELNLSSNGIVAIEGLKELSHLTHLDLSANKIQTIDALKGNVNLQLLNLSDNCVTDIPDISFLKDLKHLYLHGNRLTSLRQCEEYLPSMLESLTLARNRISDLNEISSLSNLNSLHHLTIYGNPCVHMDGKESGFDYRPFVLNWCMSLKTIDGNPLDPIESLKAEWLYSQGRGRQFRVGEHENLVKYLDSVCPLVGKALENDSDRKLRLILSKAQHHQRQLRDEISESVYSFNSLILSKKQLSTSKNSPKSSMFISCDGNISSSNSADKGDIDKKRMAKSATGNIDEISPKAQSTTLTKDSMCVMKMPQTSGETDNFVTTGSLITASKMVPVPETLMSPDVCPLSSKYGTTIRNAYEAKDIKEPYQTPKLVYKLDSGQKLETNMYELGNVTSTTKRALLESKQQTSPNIIEAAVPDKSSNTKLDDCDEMFNSRMIKNIKDKAAQRNQQQQQKTPEMKMLKAVQCPESSAVIIQKMWRGYNARKKNKSVAERLIEGRTQEYFKKLSEDVEATKAQLDTERRVQRLQMQAINALWKKISALNFTAHTKDAVSNTPNAIQSTYSLESDSNTAVLDLTRTCMLLGDQIQQLQESMRSVVNCITMICGVSPENVAKSENADVQRDTSSTQTEIVAVHTPISDMDLECLFQVRPSSLSLNENNK